MHAGDEIVANVVDVVQDLHVTHEAVVEEDALEVGNLGVHDAIAELVHIHGFSTGNGGNPLVVEYAATVCGNVVLAPVLRVVDVDIEAAAVTVEHEDILLGRHVLLHRVDGIRERGGIVERPFAGVEGILGNILQLRVLGQLKEYNVAGLGILASERFVLAVLAVLVEEGYAHGAVLHQWLAALPDAFDDMVHASAGIAIDDDRIARLLWLCGLRPHGAVVNFAARGERHGRPCSEHKK